MGMRRALEQGADFVFLLNNDTLVDQDLIAELVTEAARRPDAGALCPLIYYADPPDLVWYAGASFDPHRGHNGRQLGYKERDSGQFAGVRETGRATGAAMLIPRRVLEEVGLFDSELFLHIEDVDLSLRMLEAGLKLYVVASAKVWHKVSVDSGGENSPTLAYYGMRNTLAVCSRHAPLIGLSGLRRHIETLVAQGLHARRGEHPLQNLRAGFEGWRDYRRGRLGRR